MNTHQGNISGANEVYNNIVMVLMFGIFSSLFKLLCLSPQQTGKQVEGTLNMIDFAGSERVEKSGATGDRLKESQVICYSSY
jgi:hypothetical protein